MPDDMNERTPAEEETIAIANLIESLLQNSEDTPQMGFLSGYVACVEWMRPDGTYGYWRYNGDGHGNPLPPWRINGMLEHGKGEFVDVDGEDE